MEVFAEKLSEAVKVMADKLGVAAEKLYPVLIKQAYIDARLALSWSVIGIAMLVFIGIMVHQCYFKVIDYDGCKYLIQRGYKGIGRYKGGRFHTIRSSDWDFGHFAFWALAVIGAFTGLLMFASNLRTCITAFYNPEWHAIKMILDLVK